LGRRIDMDKPNENILLDNLLKKEKFNLDVTSDQKFILYLVTIILAYSFFVIGMVMSLMGGK
jgi:hypothetical protein